MTVAKLVTAVLLLGASAALTQFLRAERGAVESSAITGFPQTVDGWQGTDRTLTERQYQLLETRDVLFREFRKGSQEVLLCVSVAGRDRKSAHPPAVCYRGQGWEVMSERDHARVPAQAPPVVQELRIQKGDRDLLVYAWYRVGDQITTSYVRQQWWGFLADLGEEVRRSSLIRVSTPVADGDVEAARRTLDEFLGLTVEEIEGRLARSKHKEPSSPRVTSHRE